MKIKALLYCTKAKPYLYDLRYIFGTFYGCKTKQNHFENLLLNGKIVAECDYEVEEIKFCYKHYDGYSDTKYYTDSLSQEDLLKQSCLRPIDIFTYLPKPLFKDNGSNGYAIHIKNLHIFDNPRELNFYSSNFDYFKKVEKAPKNMMRVWEDQESPRVLILVSPQEMCRVANKEQDVLVRRNVLKEMLGNEARIV